MSSAIILTGDHPVKVRAVDAEVAAWGHFAPNKRKRNLDEVRQGHVERHVQFCGCELWILCSQIVWSQRINQFLKRKDPVVTRNREWTNLHYGGRNLTHTQC